MSRAADGLVNSQNEDACRQSKLPYGDTVRTFQVDMIAFDSADQTIRVSEVKRGNGQRNVGQIRSIKCNLICGNFLAGVLLCIALGAAAGSVRAADLPSKTEPQVFEPPPPAEFRWTGFYVGVNVGGGIDHFAFPYSIDVPGKWGFTHWTSGITASGPIGSIQVGYNYALPFFHIVAGIEIDTDASGIRGQTTANGTLVSGAPVTATFGSRFEDFGTARLRLGYAWDRFLPYLTAGFTYATTETYYSLATPGLFATGSSTGTRAGIFPHIGVAGIGLEYAIAQNFTVKAEYLTNSSMRARSCSIRHLDQRSISTRARCITSAESA